jgi:hypothetical protein
MTTAMHALPVSLMLVSRVQRFFKNEEVSTVRSEIMICINYLKNFNFVCVVFSARIMTESYLM